ncbi:MarR family winged helix-turn-helix transcriptional regulator [Nocardia rhizosphaerihabitans]|nr:hypothetical protein [Nocardia rhizosphaerihabitans]
MQRTDCRGRPSGQPVRGDEQEREERADIEHGRHDRLPPPGPGRQCASECHQQQPGGQCAGRRGQQRPVGWQQQSRCGIDRSERDGSERGAHHVEMNQSNNIDVKSFDIGTRRRLDGHERRDGNDRRSVRVRLTPQGIELIERVFRLHLANEAQLLAAYDPEDCDRFVGELRCLLEHFGDRLDRTVATSGPEPS